MVQISEGGVWVCRDGSFVPSRHGADGRASCHVVSFRSLVIPVTSVVLNLLSVGAGYGVVVALFQWGWGQSLFGFTSTHSIVSCPPR
jgi:hypothetical protein